MRVLFIHFLPVKTELINLPDNRYLQLQADFLAAQYFTMFCVISIKKYGK